MNKLRIYKENEGFVIEIVNEFNNASKQNFINEQGFLEGLLVYKPVIHHYELEVSEELWALVINYLNSEEFQG